MPDNPKWSDIFSAERRLHLVLPAAPRPNLPATPIRPGEVSHASHCSGRHQLDGVLACRKCRSVAYKVLNHEYAHSEGHWFCELIPVNGSPPARPGETPKCCGQPMVREWD